MVGTSEFSQAQAFRYTLPDTPIAAAAVDIGHVAVAVSLTLRGDLDVTTTTLPDASVSQVRTRSLAVVRDVATGVMVGGIGSTTARVTSGAGHVFTQAGRTFRPPNRMAFTGKCAVGYMRGEVRVSGEVGYALEVSALPHHEDTPPWDGSPDARTWFARHDHELSAVGMMVLVAVPFAPGPLVSR
ncbi:hypothetical protein SAMN05192558_105125 [Actinokineospora alba]|uniref:Uncharacterized protein n=1 Tax=Actinokineospora alba TaxID=504798 RepID=A0A1H0MZW9_9PSEU|nr:hypothetical protein C8E96_4063 [Actinokineospora alba]SDH80343.1 hypothetical protein SAMN05421871_102175 [Actinokineospora alba]SDO85825.1 hypothetical protein SAMN05192558_105125 [Actinokineospora alba]